MVQFNKDGYTIEMHTGYCPVEYWQGLHSEIAHVFSIIDQNNMPNGGFIYLAQLLDELQPPWEVARKMLGE
jgi:hypothetical protein